MTADRQPDISVIHAGSGPLYGPGQYITRKLPGHTYRLKNEIVFVRGKVLHSGWGKLGSSTQLIQTDSKLVNLVQLVGHNYIYWCDFCKITLFEQEYLITQSMRSASIEKQRCIFCEGPVLPVEPGTTVRLHYRFAARMAGEGVSAAGWGGWWAEVWEW
jgi:hypothetical protein